MIFLLYKTYENFHIHAPKKILMDGWIFCEFTSISIVFHSYQDDGLMIVKGSVQWNLVYGWKVFRLKRGSKPKIARSVGQRLTYLATGASKDFDVIPKFIYLSIHRIICIYLSIHRIICIYLSIHRIITVGRPLQTLPAILDN